MKNKYRVIAPAIVSLGCILISGCSLSEQQRVDYSYVQNAPVSPAIYDKMVHGDSLSVSDIIELSRAHVSDAIVIRYIRDHDTVYYLTPPDMDALRANAVSPSVVDYMIQTGAHDGPGPGIYPLPIPIAIGIGARFH